jgi:hypothetical protein
MPNCFFRLLLTSTSLAPAICIYSVIQFSNKCWVGGSLLLFLFFALLILCRYLLIFIQKEIPPIPLTIYSVKSTDKDMLSFLLAYFLPLISPAVFNLFVNPLVSAVTFLIIFLCVYNSNAFHFNPILCLFGFHFYEVTAEENIPYMLITKEEITEKNKSFWVKRIGTFIFFGMPEHVNQ